MDEQQDLSELASATRQVLRDRNLSINFAAQRLEISREVLTKMWNGRPATAEIAEKFARKLGLDVNHWRVLNGHDAVEDTAAHRALNAAQWFLDGLRDLQGQFPHLFIPVPSLQGGVESLTQEDAEDLLRNLREMVDEGRFHPRPTPPQL